MSGYEGRIHAFLAGHGRDGSARLLADVIAFDDARIEGVHDFIQWCFPLTEASRSVPGAPVLTEPEARAIGGDARAREGLCAMLDRMRRFYAQTDGWLRAHDHNHLRITRIVAAVRRLVGPREASDFLAFVVARNTGAGAPVNAGSLGFWERALADEPALPAADDDV